MSEQIRYTVRAAVVSKELLAEYIEWLKSGHAQALITSGALSAEVSVVDTNEFESIKVDATYLFPSREVLQSYMDGPAIALREDGKTRWIDTKKIAFTREVSAVQFSL